MEAKEKATFDDLPTDVQQSVKGVLDYLLMDDREAEDFLEQDSPDTHVWISITKLENFTYGTKLEPKEFAEEFLKGGA